MLDKKSYAKLLIKIKVLPPHKGLSYAMNAAIRPQNGLNLYNGLLTWYNYTINGFEKIFGPKKSRPKGHTKGHKANIFAASCGVGLSRN